MDRPLMVYADSFPETARMSYYRKKGVMFLPFYALLEMERNVLMRMYRNLPWMMYEDYVYPVNNRLALAEFPRKIIMSAAEYAEKREAWHMAVQDDISQPERWSE